MITSEQLNPAFKEMVKCGLAEEKAHQEIGFALIQINGKESLKKSNLIALNNAVSQVGYTGLSLNHLKQEAVISDYNEQKKKGVWFLPMYRGLLKVAVLENAIVGANTQTIKKGDDYEINAAVFKNPVRHIIKALGKSDPTILTYCVLLLPNQLEQVTLFYEHEYDVVKPKGDRFSPHTNWADEMRKKSCLKRALKSVASNGDSKLNHLIALDNLQYDVEPIKQESKKEKITETIPTLNNKHEKYNGVVKAIAAGTHDWITIQQHFIVSEGVIKEIEAAAKLLNAKNVQTV